MPDAEPSTPSKAVFLSYTSDDVAVASAVCEALREAGIEVWMDRSELQGGDAWDANIQRQIRECALIIPIISKRTQARREGYFRLEWRLADERMRLVADGTPLILPVAADETREQDALVPKSFLTVQWSRLPHGHVPPAFVARVRKLLGLESPVVSKTVPAVGMPAVQTGDSLAALEASAAVQSMSAAGGGSASSRRGLWPFVTAILGVLVGGITIWFFKPWPNIEPRSGAKPLVRFTHDLPDGVSIPRSAPGVIAISPDGRVFAYGTTAGLFVRKMDELEARLIPGTEGSFNPSFSPDSQSLVFSLRGELRKVAISGGPSETVSSAASTTTNRVSWTRDGSILYTLADGIWRVAPSGGTPERVLPAREGEVLSQPQILPDGKSVLFGARGASGTQVEVGTLGGGERKVVVPNGSAGRYLPATGHLLYLVDGEVFGIAFDPDRRLTVGAAVPLLQNVRATLLGNAVNLDVSDDGTLVYLVGGDRKTIPIWVNRKGEEEPLKIEPGQYGSFTLSPDAGKVAIGSLASAGAPGLLVWDFAAETRTRLTLGANGGLIPAWSPDGSRIVYDSLDGRISAKPYNNTRPPEVIVDLIEGRPGRVGPNFFTPDGRAVVFVTRGDIGMIPLDGKGAVSWLFNTPRFAEGGAALSPDGKWLAYQSNESGRVEVYVSPFPNVSEDRVVVSNAGGDRPLWSRDGKELFYIAGANRSALRFMSAAVTSESGKFKVISRSPVWNTTLEELHYHAESNTGRPIGISRDNQRFLVLKQVVAEGAESVPDRIFIVQNWTEELKRRIPVPAK